MSTPAHIVSASIIALTATHTLPSQTPLLLLSLLAAGIPDLDHPLLIAANFQRFKKSGYRGHLHLARSVAHELLGLLLIVSLTLILIPLNPQAALIVGIAFSIHLLEDVIMGISFPLRPLDSITIHLFDYTLKHKVIVDILVITLSLFAWILYLSGRA